MSKAELPTPQQPGLRSFIVYDELPAGCFAFEVEDNQTSPHVKRGEFVVVDETDLIPAAGELFLCAFSSAYPDTKYLQVMEVSNCSFLPGRFMLSEVRPRPLIDVTGQAVQKVKFMDGPYPPEYLIEKLFRGKVVGIYKPDFRNQIQLA